jgi:hypothetical protein
MEALSSSETLVTTQNIIRPRKAEDHNMNLQRPRPQGLCKYSYMLNRLLVFLVSQCTVNYSIKETKILTYCKLMPSHYTFGSPVKMQST